MITKEEIIKALANKIVNKVIAETTWADFVASVQALTVEQKGELLSSVKSGERKELANILISALENYSELKSIERVVLMLADDSLSLSEIEIFL